jgi:hypothetical protein
MNLTCQICQQQFNRQNQLSIHTTKYHNYTSYEDYIIEQFYNGKKPTCQCGCGTELTFMTHTNPNFYANYTKNHWPHKNHTEETKQKMKTNIKQAFIDKYGVENPMEIQKFKDNIKKTKKIKYGDEKYNNTKQALETKLEKYGDPTFSNPEKIKKTNQERYGANSFTATNDGKTKVKKTKLERYGDENYANMEKVGQTKMKKYGYKTEFLNKEYRKKYNLNETKIHTLIKNLLKSEQCYIGGHEYDLKFHNFIIEVDGDVFHPKNMQDMSIIQLASCINDFRKTRIINDSEFELLRISVNTIKKIKNFDFEDIWLNSHEQDFSFNYFTKFITKDYFQKFINKHGKDKLDKYISYLQRFIDEFQPTFPQIPTKETIESIIDKIGKYDLSKINKDYIFYNNISNLGVSYLKSKFKSYWKSSFKDNISPIDVWNNKKIMKQIIKYRIGINNSNEVFDFTLHQMIRGISANRYTVSFFKPLLAAAIYKHFLKDIEAPVVFDPCCGFGGRLVGFKSVYPNGKYIGCEPNIETFNELLELSKHFTNVEIYNCKVEDFNLTENVDLSFTSIPYFDLETYSNPVEYESMTEWTNIFLTKIKSLPRLVVNIPNSLRNEFDANVTEYFIQSNTSHFDKKNTVKTEYLLSFVN